MVFCLEAICVCDINVWIYLGTLWNSVCIRVFSYVGCDNELVFCDIKGLYVNCQFNIINFTGLMDHQETDFLIRDPGKNDDIMYSPLKFKLKIMLSKITVCLRLCY